MKRLNFFIIVASVLLFHAIGYGQSNPPMKGETLPDFRLKIPEIEEHRQILGITESNKFAIPQIKADIVIIEIYSMYCPHCQREAPVINSLYEKMLANAKTKDRVRLIGIGVGNSEFEVSFFRNTYKVQFPLFSDPDFSIHKKLGEVRTPYFVAVSINKDGTNNVIYSKLGGIGKPDEFLNMILEESSNSQ